MKAVMGGNVDEGIWYMCYQNIFGGPVTFQGCFSSAPDYPCGTCFETYACLGATPGPTNIC